MVGGEMLLVTGRSNLNPMAVAIAHLPAFPACVHVQCEPPYELAEPMSIDRD